MNEIQPATAQHGIKRASTPAGLGLSGSWPALVVDQTTKEHLRWNAQGRIDTRSLPITVVHLSSLNEENILAVAVVSWRWDTEPEDISRNLLSALILAKHEYIAYLFIDTISIDQTLPKDKLIEEVAAFTQLYSKLPVIVAYDIDDGDEFERVMYRPWLLTELRAIRNSPYPVTYAGHMATKGTHAYGFTYQFERVWKHSFMATIFAILTGEMHMTDTSDFRFILHPLAEIIQAAHAQMSQLDFLLTVAILYFPFLPEKPQIKDSIEFLEYQRYEFRLCPRGYFNSYSTRPSQSTGWAHYDIFLDGMRIADWGVSGKQPWTGLKVPSQEWEDQPKDIILFDGAVPYMLQLLGLSEATWKSYLGQVQAEKTKRLMEAKANRGRTQICGTVHVNLESESVRGRKITKAISVF